ncbi:hypothetical protein HOLleu_35180 [Holothuria leucospilota]|uniref:Uncharacterized protein n=1 Tax=Holothuria leucospilota TaxID=206669 RepID=A0A9Q0YP28_HOLLE|nr:hypothetical protein HOLleu_35180 [Holothuria leucospilota]
MESGAKKKKRGRPKGSRNKQPSLSQKTLRQYNTRAFSHSQYDAPSEELSDFLNEASDNESISGVENTMTDLSSSIEVSLRRITKELKRIELNFDKALEFTNSRVATLEKKEKENERKLKLMEQRIVELESINKQSSEALNKQERFSRRNNIRIVGYPTYAEENCLDIAKEVINKVGIPDVKIERAHRDGARREGRSRHILVRLSFFQDKITALKNQRAKLQDEGYFITDDLTFVDLTEKRKWKQQVADLYARGTYLRFSAGKWRGQDGKPFQFE